MMLRWNAGALKSPGVKPPSKLFASTYYCIKYLKGSQF